MSQAKIIVLQYLLFTWCIALCISCTSLVSLHVSPCNIYQSPHTGEYISSRLLADFHVGMSCGNTCPTSPLDVCSASEMVLSDGFEKALLQMSPLRFSMLGLAAVPKPESSEERTSLGRKGKQPQRRTVHISALLMIGLAPSLEAVV